VQFLLPSAATKARVFKSLVKPVLEAGKVLRAFLNGTEREFDEGPFLGGFLDMLNGYEFDVGHGHPLGLE